MSNDTGLRVFWKDLPDRSTPLAASTLNLWGGEVEDVRDTAVAAAALAQQYAEQAAAPADDQIATLVADPGSATRGQLDPRYGTHLSVRQFGAVGDGVADDTSAINAAIDAARSAGRVVYFPPGQYRTQGGHLLDRVTIYGPPSTGTQPGAGGAGATLLVLGALVAAFSVGDYVSASDLTILYPEQVDTPSAPIVYPPTFEGSGANSAFLKFSSLNIYNAYIGFRFASCGLASFRDNRIYGIHSCFELSESAETIDIRGNFCGIGFFNEETMHYGGGSGAGSNFNLRTHSATQGAWLRIAGDGSAAAPSTKAIDALISSDNFVFGYRHGIDINAGSVSAMTVVGGEMDAVESAMATRNYGFVRGLTWEGTRLYGYNFATPNAAGAALFDLRSVAPSVDPSIKASLTVRNLWLGFSRGPFMTLYGTGWGYVSVADCDLSYYCSGTGGTVNWGIFVDSTSANVQISNTLFNDGITSEGGAIGLQQSATTTISGCTVLSTYRALMSNYGGQVSVNDFTVLSTRGGQSLARLDAGGTAPVVARGLNVDKPAAATLAGVPFTERVRLPSYTVAQANASGVAAAAGAGAMIYVSNGASNKRTAVSDGAVWRFPDGAVIA